MLRIRPLARGISPIVVGLSLLLSALFGPAAMATQVRSIDLEEMTSSAATIFSGRVVGIRHERDDELGIDVTYAKFRVDRAVKGRLGAMVEFKFLGGGEHAPALSGIPTFRMGEDVVLFLYGTSDLGFTSPVGLGQGKFAVVTDKRGRKLAINGLRNANLERVAPSVGKAADLEASWLLDLTRQLVQKEKAHAKR